MFCSLSASFLLATFVTKACISIFPGQALLMMLYFRAPVYPCMLQTEALVCLLGAADCLLAECDSHIYSLSISTPSADSLQRPEWQTKPIGCVLPQRQ